MDLQERPTKDSRPSLRRWDCLGDAAVEGGAETVAKNVSFSSSIRDWASGRPRTSDEGLTSFATAADRPLGERRLEPQVWRKSLLRIRRRRDATTTGDGYNGRDPQADRRRSSLDLADLAAAAEGAAEETEHAGEEERRGGLGDQRGHGKVGHGDSKQPVATTGRGEVKANRV